MNKIELSHYDLLELNKNANLEQIKISFKNKTINLKSKLKKTLDVKQKNILKFELKKICEAFDTLKDPITREIYDKFENNIFQNGIFSKSRIPDKLRREIIPQKIIKEIKDFNNKFLIDKKKVKKEIIDIHKEFIKTFDIKNIEIIKKIKLKEIFEEKIIYIEYKKLEYNDFKKYQEEKNVTLEYRLNSEILKNNKIFLKEEGNIYPFLKKSDLFINFIIEKETKFKYKNYDLFQIIEINLKNALCLNSLHFQTLDENSEVISLNEIINPGTVICIKEKGFKKKIIFGEETKRGDLFLVFKIVFPKFLKKEDKEIVKGILVK